MTSCVTVISVPAQGPRGAVGPPGSAGAAGQPGAAGAAGIPGPTGPAGPVGPQGPIGATGSSVQVHGTVATSSALPTGLGPSDAGKGYITTDTGHLWVWSGTAWQDCGNVTGPPGATGPAGPQGIQGVAGATGPAGASGATGPPGTPGATGPQGVTGPQGPQGAPGSSVQVQGSVSTASNLPTGLGPADAGKGWITSDTGHLWVWDGTAWVDAGNITGPPGPTGPAGAASTVPGPAGPTGPAGPAGATGPAGPAGAAGPGGATGPQGVPGPSIVSSNANNAAIIGTDNYIFVQASNNLPNQDAVAFPGVSLQLARADHTHPTDTSRAPVAPTIVTIPFSPTASFDARSGLTKIARITATGNVALSPPANPVDGQKIIIEFSSSGGSYTLSLSPIGLGTGWGFGSDITALTPTAAGKTDRIGIIFSQPGNQWLVVAYARGYPA